MRVSLAGRAALGAISFFFALVSLAPTTRAAPLAFVGASGPPPKAPAVHVVLVRDGTHTALTLAPTYAGPDARAALVIALERAPKDAHAKTLPFETVDALDRLGAPRLVELWEADPCAPPAEAGADDGPHPSSDADAGTTRRVIPPLEQGEYGASIVGDASKVRAYLDRSGYDAGALVSSAGADGGVLLAAIVDPKKIVLIDGHALLSPLRIDLESDRLVVPLSRLGSSGPTDVVLSVLARSKRFRAAGHPDLVIDTNVALTDKARDRFADVHAALFDRAVAKEPRGVATEYAWPAGSCDACPAGALDARALATLGADVADAGAPPAPADRPQRPRYIRIDAPKVDGPLPQALVASAVLDQRARVRKCYQELLSRVPGARGSVRVRLGVSADGNVTSAGTAGSTLTDRATGACIEQIYKMFAFPTRAKASRISFDVTFAPADPTQTAPPPAPGPARAMWTGLADWTLTRLHFRYTREAFPEDLVLEEAAPITGGREGDGRGSDKGEVSAFQTRYVIRHPWDRPTTCQDPKRERWGPRPGMPHVFGAIAAQRTLGGMDRGPVVLGMMLASADAGTAADAGADAGAEAVAGAGQRGCGACATAPGSAPFTCMHMFMAGVAAAFVRRRARIRTSRRARRGASGRRSPSSRD